MFNYSFKQDILSVLNKKQQQEITSMSYFESEQNEKPSNASNAIVLDEINPTNNYFYNEDQYFSSVSS